MTTYGHVSKGDGKADAVVEEVASSEECHVLAPGKAGKGDTKRGR
jgi:hypothetical protein